MAISRTDSQPILPPAGPAPTPPPAPAPLVSESRPRPIDLVGFHTQALADSNQMAQAPASLTPQQRIERVRDLANALGTLGELPTALLQNGINRENVQRLNTLLQGAEQVLTPANLAAARSQFPEVANRLDALMDPKKLEQMQNRLDGTWNHLNTIYGYLEPEFLGGADRTLGRGDAGPIASAIMANPEFHQRAMGVAHDMAEGLRQQRLDGSPRRNGPIGRAVGGVVSGIGHRYVDNHQGMVNQQAQQQIASGLDQAMAGLGMPSEPTSTVPRSLSFDDMARLHNAIQGLTGSPAYPSENGRDPATLQAMREWLGKSVSEAMAHPGGSPPTLAGVQEAARQRGREAIEAQLAGMPQAQRYAYHVLDATIGSLPGTLQGGLRQSDVLMVGNTVNSLSNLVGALRRQEAAGRD